MSHRKFPAAGWAALACALAILLGGIAALAGAEQEGRVLRNASAKITPDWRLLEPARYENISLFPVVARAAGSTDDFVTLDAALASGDAIVTERGTEMIRRSRDGRPSSPPTYNPSTMPLPRPVPQGASVNELVLVYRGKKPLVLLAGEVVTGGKQDRVISKDRIVPPGADPIPLDVFCVERGRWSAGAQFTASKFMAHPSVRERAAVDQEQGKVWDAVRSGTTSSTVAASEPVAAPRMSRDAVAGTIQNEARSESYAKIYGSTRVGRSLETFVAEAQRRWARAAGAAKEPVIGVVVAYNGEVAWADVFASASLFEAYWPKLLRSYATEALARPTAKEIASLDDALDFLRPAAGREVVESEPGVYRWRQVTEGRYAEIALEALAPRQVVLHWVKIQRTS
ncbi:MAG TPA: DUF6569 family protein [Candidatus Acidoferrales bacterium]